MPNAEQIEHVIRVVVIRYGDDVPGTEPAGLVGVLMSADYRHLATLRQLVVEVYDRWRVRKIGDTESRYACFLRCGYPDDEFFQSLPGAWKPLPRSSSTSS